MTRATCPKCGGIMPWPGQRQQCPNATCGWPEVKRRPFERTTFWQPRDGQRVYGRAVVPSDEARARSAAHDSRQLISRVAVELYGQGKPSWHTATGIELMLRRRFPDLDFSVARSGYGVVHVLVDGKFGVRKLGAQRPSADTVRDFLRENGPIPIEWVVDVAQDAHVDTPIAMGHVFIDGALMGEARHVQQHVNGSLMVEIGKLASIDASFSRLRLGGRGEVLVCYTGYSDDLRAHCEIRGVEHRGDSVVLTLERLEENDQLCQHCGWRYANHRYNDWCCPSKIVRHDGRLYTMSFEWGTTTFTPSGKYETGEDERARMPIKDEVREQPAPELSGMVGRTVRGPSGAEYEVSEVVGDRVELKKDGLVSSSGARFLVGNFLIKLSDGTWVPVRDHVIPAQPTDQYLTADDDGIRWAREMPCRHQSWTGSWTTMLAEFFAQADEQEWVAVQAAGFDSCWNTASAESWLRRELPAIRKKRAQGPAPILPKKKGDRAGDIKDALDQLDRPVKPPIIIGKFVEAGKVGDVVSVDFAGMPGFRP